MSKLLIYFLAFKSSVEGKKLQENVAEVFNEKSSHT